jgi:hypothetical protein
VLGLLSALVGVLASSVSFALGLGHEAKRKLSKLNSVVSQAFRCLADSSFSPPCSLLKFVQGFYLYLREG